MASLFSHTAFLHHEDTVSPAHRRQPVGDHYHGLALHQLLKGQLNQIFIVRVGKCRGLVQEHNGSVL